LRAHRCARLRPRHRVRLTARGAGTSRSAGRLPRHRCDRGSCLSMTALLELHNIRAGYGTIDVLHGVNLVLQPGQVYALLGPNGAGKTTTLAVCSGQILPSGGQVLLYGREINGVSSDALARAGVCLIPEGRGVFPNLTVAENLRMSTHTGASYADVQENAFT